VTGLHVQYSLWVGEGVTRGNCASGGFHACIRELSNQKTETSHERTFQGS